MGPEFMGKCILVVEDDVELRQSIGELLEIKGYTVLLASQGLEALTLLERESGLPDLILLDLMMPLMNGGEFLKAMRANSKFTALPVVVMSAGGAKIDSSQANAWLRKPFRMAELITMVERHCGPSDT